MNFPLLTQYICELSVQEAIAGMDIAITQSLKMRRTAPLLPATRFGRASIAHAPLTEPHCLHFSVSPAPRGFYKGGGRFSPDGKRMAVSEGDPQAPAYWKRLELASAGP